MKITGGFLKNQPLKTSKGKQTRPTSQKLRQMVFDIAQAHVENCTFLDLFAGSGAMGIEALSRGARKVIFIEKDRSALKAIRENLLELNLSPFSALIAGDVLSHLRRLKGEKFDLIYIDPPYEKGLQEKTLTLIDKLEMLDDEGLLFVEESSQKELKTLFLSTMEIKKKRKIGSTFLFQLQKKGKTLAESRLS